MKINRLYVKTLTQNNNSIVNKVYDCAFFITQGFCLELWDVQFVKEGASWFLRIFIDKQGGVNIEDCENVSKGIEKVLDKEDFIKQSYYLEVSSPGIERELKKESHFLRFIGSQIKIKLYKSINGVKELNGQLTNFENGLIGIKINDAINEIPIENCAVVKLNVLI